MSTTRQRLNPPPRQLHRPLTPTSPRIPGAWPPLVAAPHHLPLPPHPPRSPPPTPPVSAGLTSNLPSALSRLPLSRSRSSGDPPNTPVTPAIFVEGTRRSSSSRLSISSSASDSDSDSDSDSFSDRYSFESSRRPRRQQQERERRRRRRRSSSIPTSPRQNPHVTETRGWSSSSSEGSSSEDEEEADWNSASGSRRPSCFRTRTDSGASATVLRLEGVGAVVIEAPQRAVSAKAAGGTKLVDARRPSGTMTRPDELANVFFEARRRGRATDQKEAGRFLSEPGPGLSGNERVRKTLQSKRMEALRMGRTSPSAGGAVEFEEKAMPLTAMSMQPTPREMYYPYDDDSACSSPASRSPSPMRTPPPTTSLPLSFPLPPTHLPARPSLRPLSETSTLVNSNIDGNDPVSAYPLTPIATDLGSLAIIAGFEYPTHGRRRTSRSGSRPSRSAYSSRSRTYPSNASRSSSVSTTSIRLRSGSVVTVIPPEQMAWQRTAYVAGPIRLNNFNSLASANGAALPGLPHPPQQQRPRGGKFGSVASLDAFQQAVEALPDNPAVRGRRASDESVLEGLVEYFEDFGFEPAGYEKESLDCFWSSDVDYDNDNRKSYTGSVSSGLPSPPPEKPVPAVPVSLPTGLSKAAKRMSALSESISAVDVVETQDGDRDGSSLKRTPSLLNRGSRGSMERKSRAAGQNGQRTKLRRLMMSAGGIL